MAQASKFTRALGALKQSKADAPPRTGNARPVGKRSDPEYSPTTFFVRKDTKRKASHLLLDDVDGKTDLSDLVEQLLAKWVDERSKA